MLRQRALRFSFTAVMLITAAVLWGPTPEAGAGKKAEIKRVSTTDLGGEQRYLTHLSTDKPIYREGEAVHVRGVILDAASHKPLPNAGTSQATIEIKGPKGDTVASGSAQAQQSALGFKWQIPAGTAGGEYTIHVSFPWEGHAPAERKFDIRAYRPPRLKS